MTQANSKISVKPASRLIDLSHHLSFVGSPGSIDGRHKRQDSGYRNYLVIRGEVYHRERPLISQLVLYCSVILLYIRWN